MKDPYFNQSIDCDVHNCTYCNCEENKCGLAKIKICRIANNGSKLETICDSFKNKD